MGYVNKQPLPPECDEQGIPHPTSGHFNIGLLEYFKAMDELALQHNISPANAGTMLRAYTLQKAVGGRISNATDAFHKYVQFMDETPEEVREMQIPSPIRTAVNDLFSYLNWYYRLSFKSIETEEIRIKDELIAELTSENASLNETNAALSLKEANLLSENQLQAAEVTRLEGELKQARESYDSLKLDHEQQSALLREAEQSKTYSDQICADLRLQLSEKKEEISRLLQRNETLINENKKQQTEISDLSHQLDISRTQYDAATIQATVHSQTISTLEKKLVARNEEQADLAERYAALERQFSETQTALERELTEIQSALEMSIATGKESYTALTARDAELASAHTALIQANAQLTAERSISDSLRDTVAQLAGGGKKPVTKSRTLRNKNSDSESGK